MKKTQKLWWAAKLYLFKYTITVANTTGTKFIYTSLFSDQDDLLNEISKCNFSTRLIACKKDVANLTLSKLNFGKPSIYDTNYVLEWAEFIGPVITFPLTSLIGFILNLMIALVITYKTNQKDIFKRKRMFEYILVNSIFNMIECFLSLLTVMGECLGNNSIFCSSVMDNVYFAYFKI